MNERIKLLDEQALHLVANEHSNGDESRLNTDSIHVKILIQKKFAELIVRECSDIVEGDIDVSWEVSGRIIKKIKQHFGVEE